jgi:hypothetical protein
VLRKPQVPRDCTRIGPPASAHDRREVVVPNQQVLSGAHAKRVPRNLHVARPLSPLNLHDAALDDVVDVSVADGAVLGLPEIDRAEDGLNFLRL